MPAMLLHAPESWGKWGQSGFFVEPVPMRSTDPTEKLHSDPISLASKMFGVA